MEALAGAARARSILEKVDEGEGTIGLLLNDPTLYDDLKSLVGGAQRSLMVRSLIRLSSDQGAGE
jgi:phospholipid/cholesterol/gamma-HCH transport system substrate-binding protein